MDKPDEFLFPSQISGQHFSRRQALTWFDTILKSANIAQDEDGKKKRGACIHSLRHVFVINSIYVRMRYILCFSNNLFIRINEIIRLLR